MASEGRGGDYGGVREGLRGTAQQHNGCCSVTAAWSFLWLLLKCPQDG